MDEADPLVSELRDARTRFLALVADVRPELHRYCARMMGSVVDGEDVVQETLAQAYFALAEYETPPPLRPWLFRIAHHRAIDHLRRYERRMGRPLDEALAAVDDNALDPEDALAREQALHLAVARFVELAPAQRSAVILKDVLGHALDEIAVLMELSVPAVKAALHRGRERLRALATAAPSDSPPPRPSPEAARYTALFNARDWDALRSLLAEDAHLDLVSRVQRAGRREVGDYFTNYAAANDWHFVPARLEGREVLAVLRDPHAERPAYFVELTWDRGRLARIRDFRYVPYIAAEAGIELA